VRITPRSRLVILSGGSGTDYGRCSTPKKPKTILSLLAAEACSADTSALCGEAYITSRSLLALQAYRNHAGSDWQEVGADYPAPSSWSPARGNTAPAITLAALAAENTGRFVARVMPSDQSIKRISRHFQQSRCWLSIPVAQSRLVLVTFGIEAHDLQQE